jgi:hypothetical protein
VQWYHDLRTAFDQYGVGWAVWDYYGLAWPAAKMAASLSIWRWLRRWV